MTRSQRKDVLRKVPVPSDRCSLSHFINTIGRLREKSSKHSIYICGNQIFSTE